MKTVETLIDFHHRWDAAIERNDADEIGTYMHDDWQIVSGDGITLRHQFLESIRSGRLVHTKMSTAECEGKIYNDTGIITAKGTSAGLYQGTAFSFDEQSTSVFLWEGQTWKCVITMLAPLKQPL
ncbi:MAG TPA: nuclear transport factor 2 family protein [Ohtaekwangia sp.]|nr:nuclear transport factor 2 family protein [Ohtaekwangia sp.]